MTIYNDPVDVIIKMRGLDGDQLDAVSACIDALIAKNDHAEPIELTLPDLPMEIIDEAAKAIRQGREVAGQVWHLRQTLERLEGVSSMLYERINDPAATIDEQDALCNAIGKALGCRTLDDILMWIAGQWTGPSCSEVTAEIEAMPLADLLRLVDRWLDDE